jgi:hypothetical protein
MDTLGESRGRKVSSNVRNTCALSLRLLKTIQFTFQHYAKNLPYYSESMHPNEYPMVISKLLEEKLFTDDAQKLAIEADLLIRHMIDDEENPGEWGRYTIYYYTFSETAIKLFTGEMKGNIPAKDQERLNRYVTARIGTKHLHVIESMKLFRFDLSSKAEYVSTLLDSYRDDAVAFEKKVNARTPTKNREEANQFYSDLFNNSLDQFFSAQKYAHSNGLLYHLFSTCDIETWAGRVYTPFTAIKSEGRPFIYCTKYPDDRIVELDFATFQVHCLVYAIEQLLTNKNVGTLKQDLLTKDFYNELGQEYYTEPKNPISDDRRKRMKKRTLTALFGKDMDRKTSKTHAAMKKRYPEFTARLDELRTGRRVEFSTRFNVNSKSILYKQTSFFGTFYEVRLMERIWKKLSEKKIPYLTIHDAVLVPESTMTDAIEIMEREAKAFFGYAPAIDPELLVRPDLCKPKK